MTTTEDAVAATGIPADQIADIDDAPEGLVVTTNDGARYVLVPADKPDQDGKTGLMYLVKPDPNRSYSFPVYTPHDVEEAAEIAKPKRGKKVPASDAPTYPVEAAASAPATEAPVEPAVSAADPTPEAGTAAPASDQTGTSD